MNKHKKILIISYSYPPSNAPAAQRPYAIAKYLDKEKYDVTVLICGNQDSSLGFNDNFNEALPDVKLIKVNGFKVSKNRAVAHQKKTNKPGFKAKIKGFVINILSYFVFPDKAVFWFPKVKKYIKANKDTFKTFDVIFSTSPMFTNHLVARQVKKLNPKAKLIADFRDFHYLENYQHQSGLKSYLHKKLEYNCLKRSDKICFISDAMKEVYAKYYTSFASKFHTIYNGFDISEYDLTPEKITHKKLSIFYAGSFYKGVRDPLPLLNILEELIKQNFMTTGDIQIEIAGNFEQELVERIKHLKIFESIRFLGLIPRNEVLKKYKQTHLLWLIVGNKVSHYTGVPIKFYEYLISQRPVINFAPAHSEPTKIIKELDAGWNFDTDNIDLDKHINIFKTIIEAYKSGKLEKSLDLSKVERYSRKKQTQLLEQLF